MLEPKYTPDMTPAQRQAIAKAKARLRLQQGQASEAPAAPQAIPPSGMGAMGSKAPGDAAAFAETVPQIKPQTTNPQAPGYFDPLAPAVPNNQNPKSPDFQFNWQRDYPQAEPTPEIQLPAVPEGWTADEWYMDRAAGIERRNAEALRATSNPVVDAIRTGDKWLMDAGQRFAYKLDPRGQAPQFISENVTPAAQKLMGGLASKLPYGETMGPMGEAIGGGLSEFAATTARNPVQGMSEATDMLEPTHYIARGANSLGEAGSQALAGNWDAARQAYMEATPDLLIGTVGVVPFGSATVAGMQRAVQAPRAALRAEAQRALGAADDLPTMPPGAAQTATQAQPSPAPVTPQAVAPPAAQAGPQFFDPKGDPLDVKIVARSETGSYVVQTKDGREVIVGFDGVLPQSARSPDYVPETMDFGGRKISDLSDEELAALKQRAEEKIKVMKTEGQEQSIPSMLGERNAATYEQKRRAAQAASSSTQPTVPQAPRGGVQTATQAPPVQGNGVAVDSFNALPVKTREGMLRALSASGMSRDQAFAAIRSLNDLPPERANMFEAELIRRYGGPDQFPNLKTNLTAMGSDFSMQVPGKGGDPQGVMNRSLLEQAKSEGEYLERMAEQIFGPGKVATKADLEQYSEVLGGRYRKLLSEQYPGVGRMRGQNRLAEQQRIDGARSQLADYLKRPDVMANVPTWVQDEVMLRVSDDLRRMKFTPEEQAIILQGNPELAPLFTPDRDLIYSPKLWATIVDLYPTQVGHSLQSAYRIAIDSALKGTDAAQRTVAKRLMRMRGQSKVRANAANPDKRGFGLLNLLEDAVPGYKALRQEFGDVAGATTAADMPNKFFRVAKDEEALDDFITVYNDELTPLQQEAVRNGITTQIRQALRNKTEFTDLTELDMPAMRGLPNITQITSQPFLEALPKVFGADGQRMVDAIRLSRANIGNIASINDAFKSGTPKGMAIQKNGRNIYENPSATDANPIDAATSTLAGVGGLAAMTGSLQVAAPVLGGAALRGLYRMYKRGKSLTPGQKAALAEWLFKPRRATDALPPSTPRRFSKVGYAGNVATGAAVGATAGAFQGDPTTGALVGALGGATRAKLRSMRANRSIIPTAPPPPRPRNPLNPFSARAAQAAVQGGQAPRALPGQTSNASATVTGALVGGGIGAAANPDDPGKGAVYGALAGGALTGGARKLLGNSLKTGAPRKGPPGSPARVKRIVDMVAVGDKGVVDVARSMPKADVLAAASKIASEGVPGGVKITNVDEAVQIIDDAAEFQSFASDITRSDMGLRPYPELRTSMKSGEGKVIPLAPPKPAPVGAKPGKAPPTPAKPSVDPNDPFGDKAWAAQRKAPKPLSAKPEPVDTTTWTPEDFRAAQQQLNALMQERRTAPAEYWLELDTEIATLRSALGLDDLPPPKPTGGTKPQTEIRQIDGAAGLSRYAFSGPDGWRVEVGILDDGSVHFGTAPSGFADGVGGANGAGQFSGPEAAKILRGVGEVIARDAGATGRARYVLEPQDPRMQALVRKATPPAGYTTKPTQWGVEFQRTQAKTGGTKPPPAQAGFARELGAGGAAGVATAIAGPRDMNGDGVIDEQERAAHSMSVLSNAAIAGGVTRFARSAFGKGGPKPPPRGTKAGPDRGTFAGVNARTADTAKLARAQEMARAGATREAIWDETGWFKGVDGKWRFEIDDSGAKLTGNKSGPLSSVMDHPELFNAYPDLASTQTQLGGRGGAYIPAGKFNDELIQAGTADQRSVLLHEAGGHGVQRREGFARGGNPDMPEVRNVARSERDASLATAKARYDSIFQEKRAWEDSWVTQNKLRDNQLRWKLASDEWRRQFPDKAQAMDDALDLMQGRAPDSFGAYQRLAGEAEARNVQTRDAMRRRGETPGRPWETQDVPDEQQIVRFGGGVAESRPPKPPTGNGLKPTTAVPVTRKPPEAMGFGGGKGTPKEPRPVLGRRVIRQIEQAAKMLPPEVRNKLRANAALPPGARKSAAEASGDDPSIYRMVAPFQNAKPGPAMRQAAKVRNLSGKTAFPPPANPIDTGVNAGLDRVERNVGPPRSLDPIAEAAGLAEKRRRAAVAEASRWNVRTNTQAREAQGLPELPIPKSLARAEQEATEMAIKARQALAAANLETTSAQEARAWAAQRKEAIIAALLEQPAPTQRTGPNALGVQVAGTNSAFPPTRPPKPVSYDDARDMAELIFEADAAKMLDDVLSGRVKPRNRDDYHMALLLAAGGTGAAITAAAIANDAPKRQPPKDNYDPQIYMDPGDPRYVWDWEKMKTNRQAMQALQVNLNALPPNRDGARYNLSVDAWGPKTEAALKRWQYENGFEPNGVMTAEQWELLDSQALAARRNEPARMGQRR